MGVSGLLGLLKSIQKPCNLKAFHGQTLGVDAYGWLHRASVSCAIELAQGKPTTKLVDYAMHRVRMLLHFGVTPYMVFDGDRLPSKSETERGRAERRKASRKAGLELLSLGKIAQAHQELQKAVDITPELAKQLILELRRNNIKYVVAPYEADSQLVYLEQKGIIDGILSEDSDLLVFGAKTLLTKLDQYGDCIMIRQEDFTECREVSLVGWTCQEFRHMAILSGCDYLAGINKMGLKTAYRLVRKCKTIERIVRCAQLEGKFQIPAGYLQSFDQAEKTFLYQWVYCPLSQRLVNLTTPESEEQLAGITYIGKYVDPKTAQGVAAGDLNPMTKDPIIVESIPNYSRRTPLLTKAVSVDSGKGKSIDSFFKPKRTPLAEVDPNTFTPSPSQQRLLQQNIGRSWSFTEPDYRPASAPNHMANEGDTTAVTRKITSAPHPNKRPRLCSDNSEPNGERSRFFTPTIPEPSPSLTRGVLKKRTRLPEINIWSDDSLDDAMVALPEASFTSALSTSTPTFIAPSASTSSDLKTSKPATTNAPSPPMEPQRDTDEKEEEEEEEETVFPASLLAQTRALRETFSYNKTRDPPPTQSSTPTPTFNHRNDHQTEPETPPPPRPQNLETQSTETPPATTTTPDATIPETPRPPQPSKNDPTLPTTPRVTHPKAAMTSSAITTISAAKTSYQPKGSEDLLVIPDSDADVDSEWDADLSASSPPPRTTLNLAAFAFVGSGA